MRLFNNWDLFNERYSLTESGTFLWMEGKNRLPTMNVLDLLNLEILQPKSPAGFSKKNIQRFILRQLFIHRKTPSVISQGFILGPFHIYARYMACLFLDTRCQASTKLSQNEKIREGFWKNVHSSSLTN